MQRLQFFPLFSFGILYQESFVLLTASVALRWPNTFFKCLCLFHHYFLSIYALAPNFCITQVDYRRIYSRILVRVRAVTMATRLVDNKA